MSPSAVDIEIPPKPVEGKQARIQALLNQKEITLLIRQLVLKHGSENPTNGKKERIGYESLKDLAKKAGTEIADLELSTLPKGIGKDDQFCTADGEAISEKTLSRYVQQITENMTALSGDTDEVTITVYYLTTEQAKDTFLDNLNTKEQLNTLTGGLRGEGEKKGHTIKELGQAKLIGAADLMKEANGNGVAGTEKYISPKEMNLKQWRSVFQSLQLLNGDYVRGDDNKIYKATKPAFRIQRKTNPQDYLSGADDEDKNAEQIPAFQESHETSIKMTEVTGDLQRSLESSGFTEASLAVVIGASAKAFSASGGLGVSYKGNNSQSSSGTQGSKEIKGSWNAPRVEVALNRTNMALDSECKAALDAIIQNENYDDVVNFYKDYGTIFAQRVLLGGRLTTSQIMTSETTADTRAQSKEIRVSMEASIKAPFVAKGDMKAGFGTGSSSGEESSTARGSASLAWQAQGGDTHLAQSPAAWLPTVKDFSTWFAIQKDEVVAMDEMIAGFPGYARIPTLFAEIIARAIHEETAVTAPWAPELFRDIQGARRLAGLAIDSNTGRLRESPFEPLNWNRINNPTQSTNPGIPFSWQVFGSVEEINTEVSITLQEGMGVKAQINAATISPHVYSLQASERSLSVMMKWVSSPRDHSMASPWMKLTPDAAATISKDEARFYERYGDRFVCGWVEQAAVIIVWTIEAKKRGDEFVNLSKEITTYFANPRTLEEGCKFFTAGGCRLINDDPSVNCFADVYQTSLEAQSIVLTKGRANPEDVMTQIGGLDDEEYIPTKVHLKSYRAVYPRYTFCPPQFPVGLLKKARDLFQRNIMLQVRSKASPFRSDSPQEKELLSKIKELRSALEQRWNSCVADKGGLATFNDPELKHTECEDSLSMRFFARDWLRHSAWTEGEDISTKDGNYTSCWTKVLGLQEPQCRGYNDRVVNQVKGSIVYFEDKKWWNFSLFDSHDNNRYFEVNQSHKYYLVYYQMENSWGSGENGSWRIHWPDRYAVGRHNPRIAHKKDTLRGYSWVLKSWWLPKDSFPFIEEEL